MSDSIQVTGAQFQATVPYCALEWATPYLSESLTWGAIWNDSSITDVQRQAALVQATKEIDQQVYIGRRLNLGQEREFPRYLEQKSLGDVFYLQDNIPLDVAKATAIQAAYLIEQHQAGHNYKGRQDIQAQGLTGVNRVGASESYDLVKARRHQLCREAYELLVPYIAKTGSLESPYSYRST